MRPMRGITSGLLDDPWSEKLTPHIHDTHISMRKLNRKTWWWKLQYKPIFITTMENKKKDHMIENPRKL